MGRRGEQPPLEGLAKTHQSQIAVRCAFVKVISPFVIWILFFGFFELTVF